jgi:UDP-N-acetylmuramate dehydrogenase
VITRVDFDLVTGERGGLWQRVLELRAKRATRQPGDFPNAGSVFRNPPGFFAGRLMEAAGLKGTRMGGAAFSEQHANFIVNLGGARADEVRALMELARGKVHESTGLMLEPEVKLVGDW